MPKKPLVVDSAKSTEANIKSTAEAPPATQAHQDEFAGQGGSYFIDPATNQRVKNLGETQHG